MLRKASRLALPALLSLFAAAPAAPQSQGAGPARAPASCQRTRSDGTGAVRAGGGNPNLSCSAPREVIVHGGWLAHAIMLVDLSPRLSLERLRPASASNALDRRTGSLLAAKRQPQPPPLFAVPAAHY